MTLMNGQTGKVGGGYPKSPLKIALTVLVILKTLYFKAKINMAPKIHLKITF